MSREDYYERMYDLFVALYKNVRFSRPGWSMELYEKDMSIVIKYTMGEKVYVAIVRTSMYSVGMNINAFRHEKNGYEPHLTGCCLIKENCHFDRFVEEADTIAQYIENDMLQCFRTRVLYPAIDNLQVSYWEMNQWKKAANSAMAENIDIADANMANMGVEE